MNRFDDAKNWGALDLGFQGNFNYLIDLLNQGYVVDGLIGENTIKVSITPNEGIKITNDSENIFSIDPITGEIVIGKYDDAIVAAETDAKDDLAEQLGYADYAAMVAAATAGNTIINGGYLRTELIDAGTILFNQLAAAAVTSINGAVTLGSRNLLRGTELGSFVRWTANTVVSFTAGYPTFLTKATRGTAGNQVGVQQLAAYRFMKLEANVQYILSFEVRGTVGLPIDYVYAMDAVTGNHRIGLSIATVASTTAWQTVSRTFTRTTASAVGHVLIASTDNTVANWFEVRNVKIEQGNKATAWTPNTDDQVSQLITYQGVQIDAANGFVSTATIDGKTIQVKVNSTEGFSIYNGLEKVFGVDTDGNQFASRLAYVDDPETKYGIIGNFPGVGYGLALYDSDFSANPFFKIAAVDNYTGVLDGVVLYDHNELPKIVMYGSGANTVTTILDSSGNNVIEVSETAVVIEPATGNSKLLMSDVTAVGIEFSQSAFSRMVIDSSESYLRSPDGSNEIMVNNTDAYVDSNIIWHDGNGASKVRTSVSETNSNLTDNNVMTITPAIRYGICIVYARNSSFLANSGIFIYRCTATNNFCSLLYGNANCVATTGALTGTTGTDGKFTVSAHTDGKLYFENRSGSAIAIGITFLGI